jgi:hypothetical protein
VIFAATISEMARADDRAANARLTDEVDALKWELDATKRAREHVEAENERLRAAAQRLLAGLDALDRGCENEAPGFRGWHNGHGEEVGDEAQDAREALARVLEGPNAMFSRSQRPDDR